ncbi:hypothetical protein TNCV_1367201 [Trichonephila clavipes]|nr:hypothetical protein TNCV_1367201 [Trichonephila clavipes]
MPFLKAKSHRAHSVVSGVRVKLGLSRRILGTSPLQSPVLGRKLDLTKDFKTITSGIGPPRIPSLASPAITQGSLTTKNTRVIDEEHKGHRRRRTQGSSMTKNPKIIDDEEHKGHRRRRTLRSSTTKNTRVIDDEEHKGH